MKRITFFKSLLLAAGLMVGASAWATDVPYNVGESTEAGYLSSYSDVWEMAGDGVLEVTFTNHCKTNVDFWFNWHLICGNSTDSPTVGDNNINRYFVMRSDRWENVAGNATNFFDVSSDYFTDFMTYQNEATVNLKITRTGTTVNVFTTVTKNSTSRSMTYYKTGIPKSETIKFYLTGSQSYMTITSVNQSTNVKNVVSTNALFTFTGATISNKTIVGEIGTMTWSSQWTTPAIENDMFRVGDMNDGVVALVGDAAGTKDIVTVTFDLGYVQLSGKFAEFKVTDKNGNVLVDESVNMYNSYFENEKNTFSFATSDFVSSKSDNPGMTADNKNSFTLTFNYATRKINGTVVNNKGTVNKVVDMPDGAASVASFAVRSNHSNAGRRCYFDNLRITTTIGDYSVTDANYTVSFVDENGTKIKEDIIRSGIPGSTIAATTGDKESFFNVAGTMKYFYKSDDAEGKTIAEDGSTVLTITYREAETYNYTLKSSLGTTIYSGATLEGEQVSVPYPKYEFKDGKLYSTGASDDNGKQFRKTFIVTSNNQEVTLTYSENLTNVVFYTEGEDVAGVTSTTIGNASVRGSMCAAGYNGTDGAITVTTLSEIGTYKMTVSTYGSKGSYTFSFRAGDKGVVTAAYPGTNGPHYSGEFIILGSTDIIWPATDANHAIDYIIIEKLSSETSVSVPVSNGYATYANHDYALDFSNVEGLKAYTATLKDANTVTFTPATKVPAGTGLLLKGVTADVPAIASAAAIDDNVLYAPTEAVSGLNYEGETYYNYILTSKNGKVGFYKANNSSVAVGKAYIRVARSVPGSRDLTFIGFDDDNTTTGIDNVITNLNDNNVFDLQGRRVNQPVKGLYIMNGKKVIFK